MATNSVDLLSVISGIQVSDNDILQAELLLSQTLLAKDPTLDIRTGTALRDISIRPSATLLAVINKALVYYWTQNSLSSVDDTTPTVFVDKILGNFFMSRFTGESTIINVKLFFAKAVNVTLTTDMYFSVDNTNKYFPIVSATYAGSQLVYDPSSNQYYLSVDLQAETPGISYNISTGSLIYYSNFNPYFLHGEISYLKTIAKDPETNTEFISRAQNSISTRNLINRPSITSNIMDNFSIVSEVYSVGMTDPEMVRDKVIVTPPTPATPIWVHLGGRTDVYCRVPLVSSLLQFETNSSASVPITGAIYKAAISNISGGGNTDTIDVTSTLSITNDNLTTATPSSVSNIGTVATIVSAVNGLSVGERFTLSGAIPSFFNGTYLVTSTVDQDTFTYEIGPQSNTTASVEGTLQYVTRDLDVGFSYDQAITIHIGNDPPKDVTSVVWNTGVVTITFTTPHGYTVGSTIDQIFLDGVDNYAGYHSTLTVADASSLTFLDANNYTVVCTSATSSRVRSNESVSLELYYFQDLDGIQTYLTDSSNRVLAGDQLSRGCNITMLTIDITGYGPTAPSQGTSTTVVTEYLSSLGIGQSFIMADLLAKLYEVGITTIKTPLSVTYTKYWRDLLGTTSGIITDALNPDDSTNIFMLEVLTTDSLVL